MITKRREHIWLLMPTFITLLLITIFPLFYALNVTLRDYSLAGGKQVHVFNNFKNYAYLLRNPEFYHSLWVTLRFAFLCVAIELVLGSGLAILFNSKNYRLEPASMMMMLPMAIAPAAIGLVFRWFYSAEVGFIPYMLNSIGLPSPSWNSNGTAALFSLVIADVWEWTPYVFLICTAGLRSIQEEIYEAADIDGAGGWRKIWQITLPMLKPTLIVVILLRAIPALKEFDKIYIITDGGPGRATEATSAFIFKQFLWFNNLGTATAAAFILLVVITISSQVMFGYLRRHEEW